MGNLKKKQIYGQENWWKLDDFKAFFFQNTFCMKFAWNATWYHVVIFYAITQFDIIVQCKTQSWEIWLMLLAGTWDMIIDENWKITERFVSVSKLRLFLHKMWRVIGMLDWHLDVESHGEVIIQWLSRTPVSNFLVKCHQYM